MAQLQQHLTAALLATALWMGPARACAPSAAAAAVVAVDERGDVTLADGRLLRLAGIAWPGAGAPDARRRLRAEASALLLRETVRLAAEGAADRWGRVPAQVFVDRAGAEPLWLQGQLVEDGLALFWPEPAARRCHAALAERDMLARDGRLGPWSALGRRMALRGRAGAADPPRRIVYEGWVRSVRKGRAVTFVNFRGGRDRTPTWFVPARLSAEFARSGRDLAAMSGQRLRVRAELSYHPRPRLAVSGPEAVEILD